jgi:hypothetical protein
MVDEIGGYETQRDALALGNSGPLEGESSGLRAEILMFTPRSRGRTATAAEFMIPKLPFQPHESAQPPLSANVSPYAQNTIPIPRHSWLFDALVEIDQLPHVSMESGFNIPPEKSLEIARVITRLCNSYDLSEPSFDVRESGDVEVFCREDSRGLLIIIQPNGPLQVFGDFGGEQWRARYGTSGSTWQLHLKRFMQDISPAQLNYRVKSAVTSL